MEFPDGAGPESEINYDYLFRKADGSDDRDWGGDKVIRPAAFIASEVLIIDTWNEGGFVENAFYTEPFKDILLQENHTAVAATAPTRVTHAFKVKTPLLTKE